jgi:hypothetical protein
MLIFFYSSIITWVLFLYTVIFIIKKVLFFKLYPFLIVLNNKKQISTERNLEKSVHGLIQPPIHININIFMEENQKLYPAFFIMSSVRVQSLF